MPPSPPLNFGFLCLHIEIIAKWSAFIAKGQIYRLISLLVNKKAPPADVNELKKFEIAKFPLY
jgi:hypothetical protein